MRFCVRSRYDTILVEPRFVRYVDLERPCDSPTCLSQHVEVTGDGVDPLLVERSGVAADEVRP